MEQSSTICLVYKCREQWLSKLLRVPLALIWANTGHLLRFLGQDPFQNDIFCLSERDLLNRFAAEIALLQSNGESKEHAFMEKAKKMRHAFDTLTKAMEVQAMNMSSEVSMMKKEVMCVVKERESK